MTVWDILAALRRQWFVTLVGLTVTVIALVSVRQIPGVFSAGVTVTLLAPGDDNPLRWQSESLISTADLAARASNPPDIPSHAAIYLTLADLGIYDGYSARVPNSGGQWENSFEVPQIVVEATGSSELIVQERIGTTVDRIQRVLSELQAGQGVAVPLRVVSKVDPVVPAIIYNDGSPARASLMTIMIGLCATCLAAVMTARGARRRREAASST